MYTIRDAGSVNKMAIVKIFTIPKVILLLVCLGVVKETITATPINIPIQSVSDLLLQNALNSLNQDSPTRHTYKGGHLISAQKLLQPPYVVYRLSLSLEPNCDGESSCSREACVIDVKENEQGVIEVDRETRQCMYLNPQWNQDEKQISTPDGMQDLQEQEIIDNLEKQIINDTVKLDHEVQDVTDQNDRPFIAVRASHYCPGCPYELNPTLPGLETFREAAASSMDTSDRRSYKHKVINIVRVTRAVPPGSNVVRYELLMEIGLTSCPVTTPMHRTECTLSNEPIQLCLFTFDERPWLSHERLLTRNNCTEYPDKIQTMNSNVEPNVVSESLTTDTGKIDESDVTKSEIYDQIAQEGQISTYESAVDASLDIPIPTVQSISRGEVIRAEISEKPFDRIVENNRDISTEKPITGFTDKIREFDEFLKNFDILVKNIDEDKSANHGHEITEEIIRPARIESKVNIKNNEPNVKLSRKKRSTSRGPSQSKFILKLAQKGMNYIDEIDQDDKKRVIVDVLKFRKLETNDGTLYHITVLTATTNCKESQKNVKNCIHTEDELLRICKIQVHTNDHNDLDSAQVRVSECHDSQEKRSKRGIGEKPRPGGETSIPIDDEIREHVKTGLQQYSATAQSGKMPHVEIISATRQVVSGSLLKIKVKITENNCPTGEATETCLSVGNSSIKDCLITVWSQPWLHKDPEITVKCDANNNRRKRSLRGVNYSNKMLQMAEEWKDLPNSDENQVGSEHHHVHKKQRREQREHSPMVGGEELIQIDDTIKSHVAAGLKHYSTIHSGNNKPQVVRIINATRQIVSGEMLKIRVEIGESNCTKDQVDNICAVQEKGSVKDCVIVVWSQPWLKQHPEITVKCQAGNERRRRSLRGSNYNREMLKIARDMKDEMDFELFQEQHNRIYSSAEEKVKRFHIFKKNMRIAEKFQKSERGTAKYGPTKFADMTKDEFRAFTGYRSNLRSENSIPYPTAKIPDIKLDPEFDWRQYNVVTPVKDQGSCGSCWAFSVTGNVEGQYAIKHKKLLSLSEQELVDCDKIDEGCNGGLQENAYRALEDLGGLELENDYPYDGEDEKCHFKKSKAIVQVVSAVNITSNETQMAQWLVKNGPMAIGINANAMQFYMGGISHPLSFLCSKDSLDHGVLIVGYGVHTYPIFKKTYPFWIVKNSWGPGWGEQGYYRVYRGDGTCGLNTDVTSAVVA